MKDALLVDLSAALGPHGERGIGRYVRGLAASIAVLPPGLRDTIWSIGDEGVTAAATESRALRDRPPAVLRRAPSWLQGWALSRRRPALPGPIAFHATDPHRPVVAPFERCVVTAYDLIPLHEPQTLRSLRRDHRWMYQRYLRLLQRADRVIAISTTTARDLGDLLAIDPARIDVVYPVVTAPITVRMAAPQPTFIWLSALDSHKRPGLALEALAIFRARHGEGRLRMIGPAGAAEARALLEQAARAGLDGAVTVEGRVSDADLERAFQSATAMLSTSKIEGFGLPPVEAMIRGVPVVATDTAALRETVGDAAFLVDPEPDALATAMASPKPIDAMVIETLRARFSVRASAEALARAYERLLA